MQKTVSSTSISMKQIQAHPLFLGETSVRATGVIYSVTLCSSLWAAYALTGRLTHAYKNMAALKANCHSVSTDGKTDISIQMPLFDLGVRRAVK